MIRSILLAGLLAALTLSPARAADEADSPVVIELFTSQGCNACPPADALMAEWLRKPGVLPLSLHVSYWDYLGWKDTFARPGHTTRQQTYAKHIGPRQVYTPQAVIDGRIQVVGSNRAAMEAAIEAARRQKRLPLVIERSEGIPRAVQVPASAETDAAGTLWLCLYDRQRQVEIVRGENTGRAVQYVNVATGWQDLGSWNGRAMRVTLPDLRAYDWAQANAALLLQNPQGVILGAAELMPR